MERAVRALKWWQSVPFYSAAFASLTPIWAFLSVLSSISLPFSSKQNWSQKKKPQSVQQKQEAGDTRLSLFASLIHSAPLLCWSNPTWVTMMCYKLKLTEARCGKDVAKELFDWRGSTPNVWGDSHCFINTASSFSIMFAAHFHFFFHKRQS